MSVLKIHPLKEGADLKIDEENLNHKYIPSSVVSDAYWHVVVKNLDQ